MKKYVLMLLVTLLSGLLCSCGDPVATFEKNIKSGDYSEAIECYYDNIYGNVKEEMQAGQTLMAHIQESLDAYAAGEGTSDELATAIETVEKVNERLELLSEDEMDEFSNDYFWINQSKEMYESGVEYMEAENYRAAYTSFRNVIETDSENYEDAQTLSAEVLAEYEAVAMKEFEELVDAYFAAVEMWAIGNTDADWTTEWEGLTAYLQDIFYAAEYEEGLRPLHNKLFSRYYEKLYEFRVRMYEEGIFGSMDDLYDFLFRVLENPAGHMYDEWESPWVEISFSDKINEKLAEYSSKYE